MVRKVDKQELKAAIERKVAQTYEPVKPAVQLGFIHHNVESISTTPLSARFQIAPVGQVGRQAGSAQWLQAMLTL